VAAGGGVGAVSLSGELAGGGGGAPGVSGVAEEGAEEEDGAPRVNSPFAP
jgi:hypothetical protein